MLHESTDSNPRLLFTFHYFCLQLLWSRLIDVLPISTKRSSTRAIEGNKKFIILFGQSCHSIIREYTFIFCCNHCSVINQRNFFSCQRHDEPSFFFFGRSRDKNNWDNNVLFTMKRVLRTDLRRREGDKEKRERERNRRISNALYRDTTRSPNPRGGVNFLLATRCHRFRGCRHLQPLTSDVSQWRLDVHPTRTFTYNRLYRPFPLDPSCYKHARNYDCAAAPLLRSTHVANKTRMRKFALLIAHSIQIFRFSQIFFVPNIARNSDNK